MSSVTIRSYRKEREAEIMGGLEKAMEKVGYLVENQARENVVKQSAKSPWRKTGILSENIHHEVKLEGNSIIVIIGTNLKYGKYLELGHIQHPGQFIPAIGKRLVAGNVPPYPWLFPAVEMKRKEIVETLKSKEFIVS